MICCEEPGTTTDCIAVVTVTANHSKTQIDFLMRCVASATMHCAVQCALLRTFESSKFANYTNFLLIRKPASFKVLMVIIVMLRERERQRVDSGRSLKGHL